MYVADFETCDDQTLFKLDKQTGREIYNQRVWLAGYKNLYTMESTYFYSLDDFMNDILSRKDNSNMEYAFHNLKFDGSFIIPWLLHNGWNSTQEKPHSGEFSVLVDNRNAWYSITIQCTKRRKVTIWDSLKLFPAALEYLPDVYGTPTRKIQEDKSWYEMDRPLDYVPDQRDMEYFENDLRVPAETLNKHIERYGLRFKKTQASQSFYNFTQSFKAWKLRFPALENKEDEAIRPAYWGGIAYVPGEKSGRDYYNVGVFDINSSYPHKAAEMKLPYGKCVSEYGEGKHPDMSKFWVAEALVEFELKDNCLPCIPKKAIHEGEIIEDKDSDVDKWVANSEGIVKISFSHIDYYTIQESYNFKVWRWNWSLHWAWKRQKEVGKFVHKNNDNKVKYKRLAKTAKGEKKIEYATISQRAKIDNNSFYGKFGEDIIKEGKTPHLEELDDGSEGVVWKVDRIEEQGERARKYLPVAIAITAWGRQQLVKMANVLGEHFLYCDTDSIHYLVEGGQDKINQATKDGIFEVDDVKLGAWKLEGYMKRGRYLRAKCYMEENEKGEREATVAGLPADPHTGQFSKSRSCLNWENFYIGNVVPVEQANKLRTVRTHTGNKLVPVGFEIKSKEGLFSAPSQEKMEQAMERHYEQIKQEHDPIKQTVKEHGYIQTVKKDERHYEEYREMSRSVKGKYFRKQGLPLDVFADIIGYDISDLIEQLKFN